MPRAFLGRSKEVLRDGQMTPDSHDTGEYQRRFARRWYRRRIEEKIVNVGQITRRIVVSPFASIAIVTIPILHGFGVVIDLWVLWAWVVLVAANAIGNIYDRGAILQSFRRQLAVITGSLVGNIDSLTVSL